MLSLDKRPAKIGQSINTRTEKHGEELVPALDIPIDRVMLTAVELNDLMQSKFAHDCWFSTGGTLVEPMFPRIAALKLGGKYEDATVHLLVGLKSELITFENCKIVKLELEPCVGGLTALSFTVQCTPALDEQIPLLLNFMGREVEIEVESGDVTITTSKKQLPLPLNDEGGTTSPSTH